MNIIQISNDPAWGKMVYTFLIRNGRKYHGIDNWIDTQDSVGRYIVQYNLNPVRYE